jgi:hypothetical protein
MSLKRCLKPQAVEPQIDPLVYVLDHSSIDKQSRSHDGWKLMEETSRTRCR